MLLAKADVNRARGADGATALHLAVVRRDDHLMQLLLYSNADAGRTDAGGRTVHDLPLLLDDAYGADIGADIGADTRKLLRAQDRR